MSLRRELAFITAATSRDEPPSRAGIRHRRSVVEVGYLLPAALRHMDGAATAGLIRDVRRGAQCAPAGARCREEVPHLGGAVTVPLFSAPATRSECLSSPH